MGHGRGELSPFKIQKTLSTNARPIGAGLQMRSLDKFSQLQRERWATIHRAVIVALLPQLLSYVADRCNPPGSG
jgi:hypothetical protein